MKITIVQGAFLPVPAVMGGAVEKVWSALGEEFVRCGHAVTHLSRLHPAFPPCETRQGVEHIRLPGFDAPRSIFHLKALDFLYSLHARRLLPAADILITNTFWLPILAPAPSRGKLYVHVARYPKGQMRLYARAARLQTVSQPVAEAIGREVPRLRERVRVIPYPLIENAAALPSEPGGGAREKELLFVGRIHPEKGVHLLLQAFAAVPAAERAGWRLVIVGPKEVRFGGGGESYFRELQILAAPIAAQVDWAGAIFDPEQLATRHRRAALFVYPSLADRGETFGLAPLEAMAQGCVPVVSALPCFRDFVAHGVNGITFDHAGPAPERELARELASLLGDPERVAALSAAAREKSRDFELRAVAARYLADFQSLLAPATP